MLNFVTSAIKSTLFVVLVLVLSHIIEIRGISISKHVENALGRFGYNTTITNPNNANASVTKITREASSAIQPAATGPASSADRGTDFDEQELHKVIEHAKRRR